MVFNLPNGWMGAAALQPSMNRLSSWWFKTVKDTPKEVKKGLNSLIILVAWEIWKHRNDCVFNGASPRISLVYCWSKGTPRNSVWVAPPGRLVSPRGGGGCFGCTSRFVMFFCVSVGVLWVTRLYNFSS